MVVEIIKVKTDEQLQEGLSVRIAVFVEEQNVPRDLEMDEFDASPQACRHFVVRNDLGETIAAARWRMYDGLTAKLQRIAVLKSYRGKGIGRIIIDAMEADIREGGVPAVILDAQTQAEAFYRKLGYETISSEPFLDAGIWHVRMRKQL
ncbi:GNAT family N-acetyltransferase [Paenibacillus allorhizosphaerae]|uniref:N-acetyltransferase YjcF n=1 Tax=Paenibacillus allorhizosphaerae TaxID=2849866 RepID=A0ABN7TN90_9BACL|nr:GNAT family N-acetyltransferase [Paenibacillus allorhizosphaerae]CAG7642970.1 putative N-acetyltransferase YjcF [Paenibacillus allorhizosphaerae]